MIDLRRTHLILTALIIFVMIACSENENSASGTEALPYADTTRYDADEKTVQVVNAMLEKLGGKQLWAEARTSAIELKGDYVGEKQPWTEKFWLDLEDPRGRYEIMLGDSLRTIAWSNNTGWEFMDTLSILGEERMKVERRWWSGEPNVIYHRLAKGFPRSKLTIDSVDKYLIRLHVQDAIKGDSLCWFILNRRAEPVRWGLTMNGTVHDHVLGPLAAFDKVRFVKWGATKSAAWRYEHLNVTLSKEPPAVSFDPPKASK